MLLNHSLYQAEREAKTPSEVQKDKYWCKLCFFVICLSYIDQKRPHRVREVVLQLYNTTMPSLCTTLAGVAYSRGPPFAPGRSRLCTSESLRVLHPTSICVRAGAAKQGGGENGEERETLSELERKLGIEKKAVRGSPRDKKLPQDRPVTVLEALEQQLTGEKGKKETDGQLFNKFRLMGDWLLENTDNDNTEGGLDKVAIAALLLFPIWLLYLLVTARFIEVPFHLPFVEY